jgi:hypothetical protein
MGWALWQRARAVPGAKEYKRFVLRYDADMSEAGSQDTTEKRILADSSSYGVLLIRIHRAFLDKFSSALLDCWIYRETHRRTIGTIRAKDGEIETNCVS